MRFTSALLGIVTAVTILLVGCGGDATSTPPLPTPIPAATATPIPPTVAATVPTFTPSTLPATSTPPTSQPAIPTPDLQRLTPEALAEFAAYISATREFYHVPGAAVVIVQGGDIVYAEGFGVREIGGDDLVTPETIFSIGSLNKALTSTMLASLVDEGVISWDTPIVEFIPEFSL